jgi:CheY-like chemotaxis protein
VIESGGVQFLRLTLAGLSVIRVHGAWICKLPTLLDIGLPDIDGFEVARRLRADAKFKAMTLIAFTAFASEKARSRANEGDFDHFLVKPMPFADLLTVPVDAAVAPADGSHGSATGQA